MISFDDKRSYHTSTCPSPPLITFCAVNARRWGVPHQEYCARHCLTTEYLSRSRPQRRGLANEQGHSHRAALTAGRCPAVLVCTRQRNATQQLCEAGRAGFISGSAGFEELQQGDPAVAKLPICRLNRLATHGASRRRRQLGRTATEANIDLAGGNASAAGPQRKKVVRRQLASEKSKTRRDLI